MQDMSFQYTPNFLSSGETSELASYLDTLEFHVRMTRWGKQVKRESIGYIARNAFNDRKGWGTEYADIHHA